MPTRSRSGRTPRFSRSSSSRVRSPQRSALVYRRSSACAASRSLTEISRTRSNAAIASSRRPSGILGQRADLQPQLALGLGVGPRQLRAPDQDLVQRLAVAGPAIDALQRFQRILVVGNAVEDAAVVVRGRRRVALGQRDLGDGAIQTQLHRLVEHVRADLAIQRRDLADPLQAGQPFVAVEQRRQLRLRQRVADRERRGRARPLLVAQTRLLERGEPHQLLQPAARVGLRLDIDAHHRRQLGVAAADLVDRLQRLRRRQPQGAVGPGRQETFQRRQRVAVGGRRLQHLAPAPERVGRIAERPFQQRRDLPQQPDPFAASGRAREPPAGARGSPGAGGGAPAARRAAPASPARGSSCGFSSRMLTHAAIASSTSPTSRSSSPATRRHSSWRAVASPAMSMRLRSISTRWR